MKSSGLILDPTAFTSTRTLAAAMKKAILCDTCREGFATGDPKERLCDECRARAFAEDVPWP